MPESLAVLEWRNFGGGVDSQSLYTPEGKYAWAQNIQNKGGLPQTRQGFANLITQNIHPPPAQGFAIFHPYGQQPTMVIAISGHILYQRYPFTGTWNTLSGVLFNTTVEKVHMEVGVRAQTMTLAVEAFADGVSTIADATYDSNAANFTQADVGKTITGDKLPPSTTILSVTDENTIELSANATESGTSLSFTIVDRADTITVLDPPKQYLIMQDGITNAVYWDGITASGTHTSTIFKGTWMRWAGNRLWIINGNKLYASDYLNPIQFEETDILASGGFFLLPAEGTGLGITFDYKTLLAFTDDTTSAFQIGIPDRAVWPLTQDFQRVIFPSIGCASGRTFINQFGLSWWMSHSGLMSLDNASQTYQSSRMLTRDDDMARSKASVRNWFNGSGCGGSFGNFLFMSVPAAGTALSHPNRHTWLLDQAQTVDLNQAAPPSWSSNCTGINPVQWITSVVNGKERCFCLSTEEAPNGFQTSVWEAFIGQREDIPRINGTLEAHDIACAIETGFKSLSPIQRMRFRFAEIEIAEIDGPVNLEVYYCGRRTSYKSILKKEINARRAGQTTPSDPNQIVGGISVPQTRIVRSINDEHEDTDKDPGIQTTSTRNEDREFSLLVTWTGKMAVNAARIYVDAIGDDISGRCEDDEMLDLWIDAYGAGGSNLLPKVPNIVQLGKLQSENMVPVTPRWNEFPPYNAASGQGVFFVSKPTFTPVSGAYPEPEFPKPITIATTTPGCLIRYTTNGIHPSRTVGTLIQASSGVASVLMGQTLKAIAYRLDEGMSDSVVTSGLYNQVITANPVFSPIAKDYPITQYPKSVSITTATSGATIHYTINGAIPSPSVGTPYTGPVSVLADGVLRAIAYKTGYINSAVITGTYSVTPQAATPIYSPGAGEYPTYPKTITITTDTSGCQMRYTTNGDTPTHTVGTLINDSSGTALVSEGQTLKAIAWKTDFLDSAISSGTYTQTPAAYGAAPTPELNPSGGSHSGNQSFSVDVYDALEGCHMRYVKDDGTGPPPTSTYGTEVLSNHIVLTIGPPPIGDTTILRVVAYKEGYTTSDVAFGSYIFNIGP